MTMEAQRVVVIQDASREVNLSAMRWVLHGLSLKPGDILTVLSVLHQVNNPSTLSFTGAAKTMGYKSRVDGSMFGSNQKIVEDEVARKKKEYQKNVEFVQISKLYEIQKIEFKVEVDAGPSPKVVALEAAEKLNATWVILDRQMKKDKKYFLEKLPCGISRMKRDNTIEQLRGPKAERISRSRSEKRTSSGITYDEMLPGVLEEEDLFSIELLPKMSVSSLVRNESTSSSLSEGTCTLCHGLESRSQKSTKETVRFQPVNAKDLVGLLMSEGISDNSVCPICKNIRPTTGWEMDFTYAELLAATNGFSPENLISSGGYGSVFRGKLLDTLTIVVKEQKYTSFQGEKKFKSEVQSLGKTRHKNVVMLLGSCLEESHKLLVYEYVCNGSLDQHLSDQTCSPLTWGERMKIALGASRGIKHLHENSIIHRDIKPKNIFVTHDHEPLLGGFGFASTTSELDESSDQHVIGTFGYLAPEYAESGKTSMKTDVYSFGVILLELMTGRSTTDKRLEEKSLLGWARPLLKAKKYSELIDHRILSVHDSYQFIWMIQIAEKCLRKDPHKRLSMDKVVSALEHIMEGKKPCGIEEHSTEKSDSIGSKTNSHRSYLMDKSFERDSVKVQKLSPTIPQVRQPGEFHQHLQLPFQEEDQMC